MMKMDGRDSAECQNWEKKDKMVLLGSCICLNVCLFWSIVYALRWRVAHLG